MHEENIQVNESYQQWNFLAPLGLLFTGMGLSIIGHASIAKSKGKGWFFKGTLGLIIFNAGLSIFGEAVKKRTQYEARLEAMRQNNASSV
jgi:hypothetical protein